MAVPQRIERGRIVADGGAPPETDWRAGVADAVITPDVPHWMGGYADRRGPAEGVHLDLYAKALALEDDDDSRVVVVNVEVSTIPGELRESVVVRCEAEYGLPTDHILFNASHTHCVPEFRPGNWTSCSTSPPTPRIGS